MNKEELISRIKQLKKEKNAIILAHNYQIADVQDIADFVGDSLELSRKAASLKEPMIVFCGVFFMAETAKMLAPEKTVLLPEIDAGCPMADMATAPEVKAWKKNYPEAEVVCYINTNADVKAECDICCTSSNAAKIVDSIDCDTVLFVPDKNLAAYVSRFTQKRVIPWEGYCYVHDKIMKKDVLKKRALYPDAEVWVHPECRPEVIDLADKVLSTGKMVLEARVTSRKHIIIGTEIGMIYRLKKENPDTNFYPLKETALCLNMKKIDLGSILKALEENRYKIEVPSEIRQKALGTIEKMLAV